MSIKIEYIKSLTYINIIYKYINMTGDILQLNTKSGFGHWKLWVTMRNYESVVKNLKNKTPEAQIKLVSQMDIEILHDFVDYCVSIIDNNALFDLLIQKGTDANQIFSFAVRHCKINLVRYMLCKYNLTDTKIDIDTIIKMYKKCITDYTELDNQKSFVNFFDKTCKFDRQANLECRKTNLVEIFILVVKHSNDQKISLTNKFISIVDNDAHRNELLKCKLMIEQNNIHQQLNHTSFQDAVVFIYNEKQ